MHIVRMSIGLYTKYGILYAGNMPVLCMVHAWKYLYYSQYTYGIYMPASHMKDLYPTWNTPVPCMEYACASHGICLYQAWNTPVPLMDVCVLCMKHACFMHEFNMHSMHETCIFQSQNAGINPCMALTCKMSQILTCYMHVSG